MPLHSRPAPVRVARRAAVALLGPVVVAASVVAAPPAVATVAAPLARCTAADLTATAGRNQGSAGSFGFTLTLTNTSGTSCVLPGSVVVWQLSADGRRMQRSADPEGAAPVRVAPASAATTRVVASSGTGSGTQCGRSTAIEIGLRDGGTRLRVPHTSVVCGGLRTLPLTAA